MEDTPDHVAEILRERLRRLTPSERIEEGVRLSILARAFMRAGIRMRHADYTPEQVEEALARLLWGDELYQKAKPGRPLVRAMSDDLADALWALLDRLGAVGIDFMIVGSVAALAHGRARSTQDVNVVIDADEPTLRAFIASLPSDRFYADLDAALDARRRGTLFNVIDMRTGWKLDIVPLKRRAFSRREFARRKRADVLGVPVFVATVEDTIVAKLEWATLGGGSERQIEDVRELVRIAGERLELAYLEAAIQELGLEQAWRAVRPTGGD